MKIEVEGKELNIRASITREGPTVNHFEIREGDVNAEWVAENKAKIEEAIVAAFLSR